MTQYYVYKLINSLDNQPFYVGKGSGSRMYQHAREATRDSYPNKRSVHSKIINILNNGGKVLYEKDVCSSEQEAFEEEKRLIALYGRRDLGVGPLRNLTDGGEGTANTNPESIARRAAKHLGAKRSEVAKENMRQAQYKIKQDLKEQFNGKACSPETAEKMSKARKGKPWSENAREVKRNKPTAKPILVYKKDTGELVGEWCSSNECARDLNLDGSAIWKILKGRSSATPDGIMRPCKSHKGYTFKYK